MKNKTFETMSPAPQPSIVPQMPVRSNVRSGGDLETCQFNLNKWRDRYTHWYNIAHKQGKV